jgi:hypothetical protein
VAVFPVIVAVFPVIDLCPSLFWANSFPCYNDFLVSSKMLFVPVNAAQLVPPTGIFETVGGGFPVFFPVSSPYLPVVFLSRNARYARLLPQRGNVGCC